MTRNARSNCLGEFYHVMLRGIGRMNIFQDNEDYNQFTNTIARYKAEMQIRIDAYCLMSNHVHILLKCGTQEMALFCKKIEVSYSFYFNRKYSHVGHLFQNRYRSETINDEKYYLSVLKYIILNPQNANICSWHSYKWSSASDYLNISKLTDVNFMLNYLGESNTFKEFINSDQNSSDEILEFSEENYILNDQQVLEKILSILELDSPLDIQKMLKSERNKSLVLLKQAGISARQIERITGISKSVIHRAQ